MDKEINNNKYKGASFDKAIVVETKNSLFGIAYEYKTLTEMYPIHKITLQSVTENNGKFYDVFELDLPNKEKTVVYFDISNFYGK